MYVTCVDVDCVIRKKPHKQSQWRFDVAEYYADVGVCKPDSLVVYPPVEMGETEGMSTELFFINMLPQYNL